MMTKNKKQLEKKVEGCHIIYFVFFGAPCRHAGKHASISPGNVFRFPRPDCGHELRLYCRAFFLSKTGGA
jgi:hypothetical protein